MTWSREHSCISCKNGLYLRTEFNPNREQSAKAISGLADGLAKDPFREAGHGSCRVTRLSSSQATLLQFIGWSARTFPRLAISRGTILLQTGKMAALFDDAAWSWSWGLKFVLVLCHRCVCCGVWSNRSWVRRSTRLLLTAAHKGGKRNGDEEGIACPNRSTVRC